MIKSKTLPVEMRERVAAEVEAIIARHPKLTLRQIATLYRVPHGMLSTMRRGDGIGILTLIRLRDITGKTLDEMLGLAPEAASPRRPEDGEGDA